MSMGPHTLKSMTMSWKAPQGETCVMHRVLLTQNDVAHIVIKVSLLCWAACHECHHGREFQ